MNVKELVYKKLKNLTSHPFDDESKIDDIGIDSLDLLETVTETEDEYNIKISDDELVSIKTVKDIIDAFEKALKK